MLAVLTQAVTALTIASTKKEASTPPPAPAVAPGWKPPLKKFSGAEHESPEEFANQATEYLLDMSIQEKHWTAYLLQHGLEGDAAIWATTHADPKTDHHTFFKRLIEHFSHSSRYSKLLAKLYGHKQRSEPAAEFISYKMALFNRVSPSTIDEDRCTIITDQLKPELRKFLRVNPPRTIEDLRRTVDELEIDIKASTPASAQQKHEKQPSTSGNRGPGPQQPQDRQLQPPPRHNRPQQSETLQDWRSRGNNNRNHGGNYNQSRNQGGNHTNNQSNRHQSGHAVPEATAQQPATSGNAAIQDLYNSLAILTQAVTALTLHSTKAEVPAAPPTPPAPAPRWKPTLKKFTGAEHESPEEFADLATDHLRNMNIETKYWTAYLLEHGLEGEAATWATTHADPKLEYHTFFGRLIDHFSHPSRFSRLLAKLYGHKQRAEPAAEFISKKMALFNRVSPSTRDEDRYTIIMDQLRPEIRQFLRSNPPKTEEDLRRTVDEIEIDIEASTPTSAKKHEKQGYFP
ncbi:unnamed protein product [Diabrotica balteata]|uniref:Retrotransposon gag domain-containing protein n=1 Tax=Diabrotica balteata TaxID=107213 RepID=A0A9N9XIH0_DIABA|nr:unnamed protein product [Diabrotica balteata]